MAGYHQNFIMKFPHGNVHKLKEEVDEFLDAYASGNSIMAMQELSDVYLILRTIAREYGIDVDDLAKMADVTEKVFEYGGRTSSSLFEMIRSNTKYLSNISDATRHYFLSDDTVFEYILITQEEDHIVLPQRVEYFEVITGDVFVDDKRVIDIHQCKNDFCTDVTFNSQALIMVKNSGFVNIGNYKDVNYDKSDDQFNVLKSLLDELNV